MNKISKKKRRELKEKQQIRKRWKREHNIVQLKDDDGWGGIELSFEMIRFASIPVPAQIVICVFYLYFCFSLFIYHIHNSFRNTRERRAVSFKSLCFRCYLVFAAAHTHTQRHARRIQCWHSLSYVCARMYVVARVRASSIEQQNLSTILFSNVEYSATTNFDAKHCY